MVLVLDLKGQVELRWKKWIRCTFWFDAGSRIIKNNLRERFFAGQSLSDMNNHQFYYFQQSLQATLYQKVHHIQNICFWYDMIMLSFARVKVHPIKQLLKPIPYSIYILINFFDKFMVMFKLDDQTRLKIDGKIHSINWTCCIKKGLVKKFVVSRTVFRFV